VVATSKGGGETSRQGGCLSRNNDENRHRTRMPRAGTGGEVRIQNQYEDEAQRGYQIGERVTWADRGGNCGEEKK